MIRLPRANCAASLTASNKLVGGAGRFRFALPGDVEGGAMIDRRANDRQTERHVHRNVKCQRLERNVPLVVIHANETIGLAPAGGQEGRVGRQRAFHVEALAARLLDRRNDDPLLLAVPEQPSLARMRIETADDELRRSFAAHSQERALT